MQEDQLTYKLTETYFMYRAQISPKFVRKYLENLLKSKTREIFPVLKVSTALAEIQ